VESLFAYLLCGNPAVSWLKSANYTKDYSAQAENFAQQFVAIQLVQCQDPRLSQENPKFDLYFTLSPSIYEGPRATSGLLVYHNLDPDCHIGPASMRTLHASHVSNPVVISKEKVKSYLMRRSNSSPPTKVQSVTYYREHPKPPSPAFTAKRNYYVNASWHLSP
jgi:hypothetical protein